MSFDSFSAVASKVNALPSWSVGSRQLGVTVVECELDGTGTEHDPSDGSHKEVYLLMEDEATVTGNGDDINRETVDALRVAPDITRQRQNSDTEKHVRPNRWPVIDKSLGCLDRLNP